MTVRAIVVSSIALALGGAACAASGQGSSSSSSTTGTGGTGATGGSATTTTTVGSGGSLFDGGLPTDGGDAGLDPDAACGLVTVDAKATPADIYIAVDKSTSMFGTKWNGATAGLSAFVDDPAASGISVALNFFPLDNNPTCDQYAYKPPAVPYGLLPGNAAAIKGALTAAMPNGFSSPVYPALGGAILASIEDKSNNPGHTASVLLVTDGAPQGPSNLCGGVNPEDPAVIAMLAATGLSNGVRTFVIGLPGVDQSFANQVAAAGGTGTVILVSNNNVQMEFQQALAKVRGDALPCEYDLPDEVSQGTVDFDHVNVEITPTGKATEILPQDATCADLGWKYDDPTNPKKIVFCANSCKAVKADPGGKVQILLGCKTVTPK